VACVLAFPLWLGLGNLNNGGNAGLWYVNGNNRLGNENWNIGSRQSGWQLSLPATSTAHDQMKMMRLAHLTK